MDLSHRGINIDIEYYAENSGKVKKNTQLFLNPFDGNDITDHMAKADDYPLVLTLSSFFPGFSPIVSASTANGKEKAQRRQPLVDIHQVRTVRTRHAGLSRSIQLCL